MQKQVALPAFALWLALTSSRSPVRETSLDWADLWRCSCRLPSFYVSDASIPDSQNLRQCSFPCSHESQMPHWFITRFGGAGRNTTPLNVQIMVPPCAPPVAVVCSGLAGDTVCRTLIFPSIFNSRGASVAIGR